MPENNNRMRLPKAGEWVQLYNHAGRKSGDPKQVTDVRKNGYAFVWKAPDGGETGLANPSFSWEIVDPPKPSTVTLTVEVPYEWAVKEGLRAMDQLTPAGRAIAVACREAVSA